MYEHLAAGNLRKNLGFEVFSPRLRMETLTGWGMGWVTSHADFSFSTEPLGQGCRRKHYPALEVERCWAWCCEIGLTFPDQSMLVAADTNRSGISFERFKLSA